MTRKAIYADGLGFTYIDSEHFYRLAAALRFCELVAETYCGDGWELPPQDVEWVTVRDADVGYALGMLGETIADHTVALRPEGSVGDRREAGSHGEETGAV